MQALDPKEFTNFYKPPADSHKGQNGKLLVIGGSRLFHASIFWAADVASRIVDLVHFTSPANENNDLVRTKLKAGFWNGIIIDWSEVDSYAKEDDCILIGPGMPREEGEQPGDVDTGEITNRLLTKYQDKKWVIDGGALQEMNKKLLNKNHIITPHQGEFKRLFKTDANPENAKKMAQKHGCTILLKGQSDTVCTPSSCVSVQGGNPGMTKGGTGDVLAGLVAALYCKNDAFLSAKIGSYVNKKAGDELYKIVGTSFNSSDLVSQVPTILKEITS